MSVRHSLTSVLVLAAAGCFVAGSAIAHDEGGSALKRLSAEFQNSSTLPNTTISSTDGEVFTTTPAGPGGTGGVTVYDKIVKIPDDVDVLYVTFSAQADSHNGSALLMNARVNGALIEPLAGQGGTGGGGAHLQTGWYTLSHLPAATTGTNCNDGGGGTADCHDNAIYFSGCYVITADEHKEPKTAEVKINLADLPGGDANTAFYERSTIYIDGQKDEKGSLCKGVGVAAH
jgi:hypothetical protein